MVTVRCVIALAVSKGWNMFQMDVYNAFVQGDLDEEVYMEFPDGFKQPETTKVFKLLKPLYFLNQSSEQWNIKLKSSLLEACSTQSAHDYSLFALKKDKDIVIVLVYVDDLLITGSNDQIIEEAKKTLHLSNDQAQVLS